MPSSTLNNFKKAEAEGWAKWIKTRADEEAVAQGCYFDEAAGLRVVSFIERFLWQTKNVDKPRPVKLYDWQKNDIILPLFSWKTAGPSGYRRFRQCFCFLPKKNSKSFLASAIILYMLMADNEPRAGVYSIAYDKENARSVFDECRINAENSPQLEPLLTVIPSRKRIEYAKTNSFYQVLAADQSSRNEGFDISCLVCDELHTMRKRETFDVLRWGTKTRRQPLSVYISTAGVDRNSVCYEMYEFSKSILEGYRSNAIDFYPYVREASPDDDLSDPAVWAKANPMLGLTIPLDVFKSDWQEAQAMPSREAAAKRYNFNLWVDKENGWLSSSSWQQCGLTEGEKETYSEKDLLGQECFASVDLGMTDDLASCVLLFPQPDETYKLLAYFWCARENAIAKNKHNPYLLWADKGHIRITGENATDFDQIRNDIVELSTKYKIKQLAIDPWQAAQLGQQLEAEGIEVVKFGQTFRYMTEPCRRLENLVLTGRLRHGNNPVMDWQAGNANLITDSTGSMRIKKPTKGSVDKVDGMVALLGALGIEGGPEEAPAVQRLS